MVGCTNCGRNIPGMCRWCPGCGEDVRPLLLANQPDNEKQVTCPTCGNLNSPRAENCLYCGTPLQKPGVIGEGFDQSRGSRISLNPNGLHNSGSPANATPPAPAPGGRLSRLAQARSKFEAEKKNTGSAGADWLSNLRSDGSTPAPASSTSASVPSTPALPSRPAPTVPVQSAPVSAQPYIPAPQSPAEVSPPADDVPTPPSSSSSTGSGAGRSTRISTDSLAGSSAGSQASSIFDPYIPSTVSDSSEISNPLDEDGDDTPVNPALGEFKDDSTLPEWLKDLNAGSATPPKQAKPKAPSRNQTGEMSKGGENMPQWLRDFAAASSSSPALPEDEQDTSFKPTSAPVQPVPVAPVAAASAVPGVPAAAEPDQEEDDDQDLPDWLRNATDGYVEPGAGQKDILDWLKGPSKEEATAPASPSFGDVDVEERLNFAFGEPEPAAPSAQSRLENGASHPRSGLTSILGFSPYTPDEVLDAALVAENARLNEPAPAPEPKISPEAEDFPVLPAFPDVFDMAAATQAASQSAANEPVLRPWLVGMELPTMEYSPASVTALPGLADLKPWLVGMEPPQLAVADDTGAENIQNKRSRGTRPFSVGAMFGETGYLSEQFLSDSTPSSLPGETDQVISALNEDTASDIANSYSTDDLTGQEMPDDAALSALLASLPDLPDLALEESAPSAENENTDNEWGVDLSQINIFQNSGENAADDFDELPPIPAFTFESEDGAALESEADFSSEAGFALNPSDLSDPAPVAENDAPSDEFGQFLGAQRYTFDSFTTDEEDTDDTMPDQSREIPRPEDADDGKPSTFELPEFLANPDATTNSEINEPPTWQPLYIPEVVPAAEPAEENPDEDAELPDFLRNVNTNPIPTSQSQAAPSDETETAPDAEAEQPKEENGWASNWNEDENKAAAEAAAAAHTSAGGSTGGTDDQNLTLAERLDRLAAPFMAKAGADAAAQPAAGSTGGSTGGSDEEGQAAEGTAFQFDTEPGAGGEDDVPGWLRALSANGPVEAAPPPSFSGYSQMNQEGGKAFDAPVEDDDLPDWLRDEPAQTASSENSVATPVVTESFQKPVQAKGTTADTRQIPDWLQEPAAGAALEPDPTRPLNASQPAAADLPDWLKEPEAPALSYAPEDFTGPTSPREPGESAPPVDYASLLEDVPSNQFSGSNFFGDVEGPAWLRQTNQPQPAEPENAAPPSSVPAPDNNALPAWLRTVPPPPNAAPETEAGVISPATPMEEQATAPNLSLADQLEQLAAADKVQKGQTEAPEGEAEAAEEVPAVHLPPRLASAAVLETLLLPSTQAPVEEAPVRKRGFSLSGRIVFYILSIVLIAVALFGLLRPLPIDTGNIAPSVQTFYDQIDRLPANAKVLVSFDWDADRTGEMGPLSTAVVQHIMAKRARLVTISLSPQGPAQAARITDELATNPTYGNNAFYKYGTTYVNLGWRSGQEAGLRSLFSSIGDLTDYKNGQRAADLAATAGINSLTDFDLIVDLAGDEGSVRAWVEQVGVQPGAHLIVGVPLAVEPGARPYAQGLTTANQGQMSSETQPRAQALLAGLNQTAHYDRLLQDKLNLKTDPTVSVEGRVSAQSLAALVLIVVIILANVIFLVRRRR